MSATNLRLAPSPSPLAILYEHPHWFARLFETLDRRGVPYLKLHVDSQSFDPGAAAPAPRVFNRMSPSAYSRGRGPAIAYTLAWLGYLESKGVGVVNGEKAFRHEISKALQLSVLSSLGMRTPRTRVIHRLEDAQAVAEGLRFPILVKPNVGGSGVGIRRFDSAASLEEAAREGRLDLGLDRVGLVQEFIPARGGHIVRVECLGGEYLYGIRVHLTGETFDLCPADICKTSDGVELETVCPAESSKAGLRVEAYSPPVGIRRAVGKALQTMGIQVGGIEYVVDDRDGELYFYDVNALSNFVADPLRVIGFDPFEHLVDYLLRGVARG